MVSIPSVGRIGVDRDANVIFGVVVAMTGVFKTLRGQFDDESLRLIVARMRDNDGGTPCHFRHPNSACPDPLGFFLGRVLNPRIDRDRVRGDLAIDVTALTSAVFGSTPPGKYIMDLAESDNRSFGLSLVLGIEKKTQRGFRGQPPLWLPTIVDSVDVVDSPDSTRGGIFGLPDTIAEIRKRHLHRQLQESLREAADKRLQQRIKKRLIAQDEWEAIMAREAKRAEEAKELADIAELEELRLRWRHRKRRWAEKSA